MSVESLMKLMERNEVHAPPPVKVGEIVWFRHVQSPEDIPAIVCHVHANPTVLNLCIFMPDGIPMPLKGVPELPDGTRGPSWRRRDVS